MAKDTSTSPPPFAYTVSSPERYGAFCWDGTTGGALYFQGGALVQRGITSPDILKFTKDRKKYAYYRFSESGPDASGGTRKWLFEVPTEDQQFCAVYYYYTDHEEPTSFGDALTRAIQPGGSQFVGKLG